MCLTCVKEDLCLFHASRDFKHSAYRMLVNRYYYPHFGDNNIFSSLYLNFLAMENEMNLEKQLGEYNENGFIILENFFSKDELNRFDNTLREIIRITIKKASEKFPQLRNIKAGQEFDEGMIELKAADPYYISVIQRTISRTPEFFYLSSKPQIAEMARSLMNLSDNSPFYVSSCGMVFAHPNSSTDKSSYHVELGWHTDVFFTIPRSQFIHIWSPFVHDATVDIGTIWVCPQSHKDGMPKQKIDIKVPYNHRYSVDVDEISRYEKIPVEVKRGTLVLFARDLIHRSGKNISEQVRYSMVGLYHDINQEAFQPFTTQYKYYAQTPESYYYEIFKHPDAKKIMYEQSAHGEPAGGV